MIEVKIINNSGFDLPEYATPQSAGMDLRSMTDFILGPGERKLVMTGLFMQLPEGYEAQVRPRSGLALKHGITVLNSPGTVDADYRGQIGVILINLGNVSVEIHRGDRIAQLVFAKHEKIEFMIVPTLDDSERSEGGFGHTGVGKFEEGVTVKIEK